MNVINDVRRRYDVDNNEPSDLLEATEQALEILADQLYSTDTHFLMEFVQNAEDNEYQSSADVPPTLRITVKDSSMILSCNELGFTESNVRAICKIGASTKKNRPGFIGEKGIGFKSVFKIAEVVHVASGPYTFKFDRGGRLGMLAPIWDASIPATPGWTTFHLELSRRDENVSPGLTIGDKLNDIKPSLLLFLKKLRSIELNVNVGNSNWTRSTHIQRSDLDADTIQILRSDNGVITSKDTYFVVRQLAVMSSIREPKRSGIKDTEVVLAFPVDEDGEPRIIPQEVHAFLPLRMLGFNFVIQGDFLTSSNREDILHDSLWNRAVRAAAVDLFVATVQTFQNRLELRDAWFRYLPSGIVDPFFALIERDLFHRLVEMEIVRDNGGMYRRPSNVLVVPSCFRFDGKPLIPQEFMKRLYYLSDDYDTLLTLPVLRRLGVRNMKLDDFLVGLAEMGPSSLEKCGDAWHEAVCLQLSRVPKPRRGLRLDSRILNLQIIPLDDGSWAKAHSAADFMFDTELVGIPDHVDVRRVHQRVGSTSTPQRYNFLRTLGVIDANPSDIAGRILDHSGRLTLQSHIKNALFFFSHRCARPKLPSPAERLRLVDERRNADVGKKLYIELPSDDGRLRRALSPSARFIHPAYMRQFSDEEHDDWIRWLNTDLQLNSAPRLINNKLSSEFEEMLKRLPLRELLDVLRYFWNRWPIHNAAPWHEELKHLSVILDDGTCCTLGSTFLKRGPLARYGGIPFLPISNPESKEWNFLGKLGVITEVGVPFFVKLLVRYRDEAVDDVALARDIYKQLDARFHEDAELIRYAFDTKALVFIPKNASRASSWKHLSDVYWMGPKSMTSKVALCDVYPNLYELFQEKLGLSNAPPRILVEELKSLSGHWLDQVITRDVSHKAMDMLSGLSDLIEEGLLNKADVQNLLEEYSIFPSRSDPTELQLRKLQDIYVPGRSGRYAEAFRGKIPILELSLDRHRPSNIDHLLQAAPKGLVHDLGTSVVREVVIHGERELDDTLTAIFAGKYHSIERVVYSKSKSRPSLEQLDALSKLKEIAVYVVEGISSSLCLAGLDPISGEAELVHLIEEETSIVVLVNRTGYSDLKARDRIKAEVCKYIADAFDCDVGQLMLCMTLEADTLEIVFEMQGILYVDISSKDDDAWMLSTKANSQSSVASRQSDIRKHQGRSVQRRQASDSVSVRGPIPQDNFSMRQLHDEIDRIADMLPDFTSSSLHAVCPVRSTSEAFQEFSQEIVPNHPGLTITDIRRTAFVGFTESGISEGIPSQENDIANLKTSGFGTGFSGIPGGLKGAFSLGVSSQQPTPYQQVNGFLGERYVYELLSTIIGETFSFENWTSELRELDPRFDGCNRRSLADFTFDDEDGILTSIFYKEDATMLEKWAGSYPTYHIEVKSTSAGSREPFQLTKHQIDGAFQLTQFGREHDLPEHVYVIVRVWNVRRPTVDSHRFYIDPVRCILEGKLKIVSEKVDFIVGD